MPSNLYASKQTTFLSRWFEDVSHAKIQSLGLQGGFSGAIVWRVSMPNQDLCLRRWPQVHPSMDGLSAIHGLLQHIGEAGYRLAPVPLPTLSGDTFFLDEDHLWELAPWMPGEASFCEQPSHEKLASAMTALAEFHRAAASYRSAGSSSGSSSGNGASIAPSPGLSQRLNILRELQQGELEQLWKQTRLAEASDLRDLAFDLLEGIGRSMADVAGQLEAIASVSLPLQWCLRDVRHDHILFTGDQVTGLIDFGAVAVESVACDLARLVGSMVNDGTDDWGKAIDEYDRHRTLSIDERRAIAAFDAGGTICSATNWVRWLFVDGRSFPQIHALRAQLVWLQNRLAALALRPDASVALF